MQKPVPSLHALTWLVALACPTAGHAQAATEPPNVPAILTMAGGRVTLTYEGRVMLRGTIGPDSAGPELRTLVDSTGGVVTQVIKWTARGKGPLELSVTLLAGGEAFPCEVEPREDGLPMVRNSVGLSDNRLNRAVYDRRRDWALSVDQPAGVTLTPLAESSDSTSFQLEGRGNEITLRFQPLYYRRHRGLTTYRPWTYRTWQRSVAGWTSWFAYFDRVTEPDIHRAADVVAERLLPWGYEYLQIDDGYQQNPIGVPRHWLETNAKFPSGLDSLRRYIAGRGLKAGIWTNVTFHDRPWAESHPQYFLRAPEGGPAYGNWIGFVMDGSETTLDTLVRPVYRSLSRMGWTYFKVDALRHLRYEGYNSLAQALTTDRTQLYRHFVAAIRDAAGRDAFMLGSWGIRPELIGLLDAVRVGDDGFGYGGFAQYNSFNNVVWRNDPDHIEIARADGYRATTLTSLTGSLLMLTDRPEVYLSPRVEAARRAAPVPYTLPGQIYDVDPSRSSLLGRVDTELSGSGPRPFDAEQQPVRQLYLLDVNRPFERWSVLARTGGPETSIRFRDLGLDPAGKYLVFEFWSKTLLGAFRDSFPPGPVDSIFQVQDFCIRTQTDHPQVVATSRHVTCGEPDLKAASWEGPGTLSGVSTPAAGEVYELYLTEPPGFRFVVAGAEGAEVVDTPRRAGLRVIRMRPAGPGPVNWWVRWTPAR